MTHKQAQIHLALVLAAVVIPLLLMALGAPRLVDIAAFVVFITAFSVWPTTETVKVKTKMTFNQALLKTADLFEKRPEAFDFFSDEVPISDKTPCRACPLAWAGYYLGESKGLSADEIAKKYLYEDNFRPFSCRMAELELELMPSDKPGWQIKTAPLTVQLLRAYVARYPSPPGSPV